MILHIGVANKIATFQKRDGCIVCGNDDYKIKFTFDSEWDAYSEKTARFIWNRQYTDVDFTGDTCDVPIINDAADVKVGVYAGELRTTTSAEIGCYRSIRCDNVPPSTENDRNYANEAKEAADRAEAAAERAENAGGGGGGGGTIEVDTTLTQSGKAADAKVTGDRLSLVEQQIADMNYTPIAFDSVTISPSTAEMGATITMVSVFWKLNKTPTKLTFDGNKLLNDSNGYDAKGTFTMNSKKSWTLVATDERGATDTETPTLNFYNGVYYGAKAEPTTYDSAFILGLKKTLRNSKLTSFTANAGAGQYIFYCLPKRMGTCSFKVGGFDGGFSLIQEISFTNASGYTETYYIYRSDNAALGNTSVTVS